MSEISGNYYFGAMLFCASSNDHCGLCFQDHFFFPTG